MLCIHTYSHTLHFATLTIAFVISFLRNIHSYLPSYFHSYTEFNTIYFYIEETAPHLQGTVSFISLVTIYSMCVILSNYFKFAIDLYAH